MNDKKSDEDSIHPSETAYDKAIKRMEEQEAHIFNTPAMQNMKVYCLLLKIN